MSVYFLRKLRHTGTLSAAYIAYVNYVIRELSVRRKLRHTRTLSAAYIPCVNYVIRELSSIAMLYKEPCMTQIHQRDVYSLRKLRHMGTLCNSGAFI